MLRLWYNVSGTLDDFVWKRVLAAVKEIQREKAAGGRGGELRSRGRKEPRLRSGHFFGVGHLFATSGGA